MNHDAGAFHRSIRGDGAAVTYDCLPQFRGADHDSVSSPFGVCVSFTQHTGCVIEQGGTRSRCDVPRGSTAIVGGEPIVWIEAREPSEVVEIVASDATRRAIASECAPHATDLGNLPGETDPFVWSIAVRFRQAILGVSGMSALECDELVHALYRHILISRFGGRERRRGDGKLDLVRLNRVVDYIDSNLSEDLSIEALSEVAALSRFHFLRSFAQAVGMTPHRFVSARRFERAKTDILAGRRVEDVAASYGFRHLRHFARSYRRHHGVSPDQHVPAGRRSGPSKRTAADVAEL